jgi:cytochrome c oxidase subunit 1
MWLSHVGLNIYVHDTFYVVAHFHFMFSASTFSAVFASIYYYYYVIFGKKYNTILGYCHLLYWFFGQWLTFIPLFWVGYNGLPRRYHDYPVMFSSWQGISTTGHLLTLLSIFFFSLVLIDSSFYNLAECSNNFGIPRFYKRIQFLLYKINAKSFYKKNFIKLYYNIC